MTFRARLERGDVQLGCGIMYPSPGVIERIGTDWDWFWIDGQHGELSEADVLALVRACDLVDRPAMVRVASHAFGGIGRVLDMGAAGVIVPLVDTADQARAIVEAARFPPLGGRSYGGRRVIDRRGRGYCDTANRDTLLIVQIESPQAIRAAEKIAAVEGVDALFLGPDDVGLRRGRSMLEGSSAEELREDAQAVAAACRKHGKVAVSVGLPGPNLTLLTSLGYQMIVSGTDVGFLATGSKRAADDARAALRTGAAADGGKQTTY